MEIMLVVVLFAIVATGVSMGLGALYRTKLRSGAVDIASAARFAYHRAVTRSRTVRIVLDLDQHTVSVEEAHGQITLDMSEERAEDTDEDNAAVDPWAAAAERLGSAQQAHVGRAGFSVIAEDDGETIERYGPHRLPVADSALIAEATGGNADIRITRLITPHESEPRESGKGYIYFFPGGLAEHAVVQITDGSDNVYSVEIKPLTGRGHVYSYAYEPESLDDEDEDLRDPG